MGSRSPYTINGSVLHIYCAACGFGEQFTIFMDGGEVSVGDDVAYREILGSELGLMNLRRNGEQDEGNI